MSHKNQFKERRFLTVKQDETIIVGYSDGAVEIKNKGDMKYEKRIERGLFDKSSK
jgi:hypothetical protein